jgi:hypothetical protein
VQRCILAPGACGQSTPLYLNFKSWCEAEGHTFVMSTRAFARRMREKGFVEGKNSAMFWHGIRPRELNEFGGNEDNAALPAPEAQPPQVAQAATPPPPSPPISKDISH